MLHGYDEFIYHVVAILQSRLMDIRPNLALGTAALVVLRVPTSVTLVSFYLVEMSRGVVYGIHIGWLGLSN